MRQLVRVVAALARRLAHLVVAQVGQVRVVHLHVGGAGRGERAQLGPVRLGHVVVERRVEFGVVLAADARAAAPEMQHRGRRDRDLGGEPGADLTLQVFEIRTLDVAHVLHLAHHAHHRGRQLLGAVGSDDGHGDVGLHAPELLEKVDVKVGAPKLPVRDAAQADVLLELHDLGDRPVLHAAQLLGADETVGVLVACLQQELGAKKTADMVGTKGRGRSLGHAGLLWVRVEIIASAIRAAMHPTGREMLGENP